MDKMREEFEWWAVGAGYWTKMVADEGENCSEAIYASGETRSAWQAWQASRKALVVELPVAFPVCDDNDSAEVYFADDTRKAISAAGVAYK